ncbi:hypothetical protein BCR32DRAFT_327572 [Anaeromyces robustus]|uniref:Uncharacterized protein n=1 Tax=Anaeromyces robustus TaxID=1754192 RepID=A0A1Y1X4P0_9FUNG|nr:hypothetical protein BCR32DRAFT_245380 [Anaeromyces robustus]ORX80755.1 hypothetical protein BCR32DRAFT_327572 [Anaeromyces robustus]|eukprot:ORX80753.1 hypothetical protein BCR32DRAFT_245380 [Anaeromyces robustus]
MNFKTILSVAVLALAAVNASPVNNIETIKKQCEDDGLATFYINDNGEYTCLRHHPKKEDLDYRTCFFTNDNDDEVVCVEEGFSNIPSCSKNSGATDYDKCAYKFLEFVDDGSDELPYRIRKFPTHEKIFTHNYVIDQKECRGHDGIVLSYKAAFQYICLQPATPKNSVSISDKECVRVDGKIYCIVQDNTSIDHCVRRDKQYSHEACKKTLELYSKVNNVNITEYIEN